VAPVEQSDFFFQWHWQSSLIFFQQHQQSNAISVVPVEQSDFFSGASRAVCFFFSSASRACFRGAHQFSSVALVKQYEFFSGTSRAVWIFQRHQLSSPIFQVAPWKYVLFSLRQQNYSRCLTYQIWSSSGNQIWKGSITHGSYEMVHCNTLISNTMQQKYKYICLVLEKYTITWNSFVSGWKRFYDWTLKCII